MSASVQNVIRRVLELMLAGMMAALPIATLSAQPESPATQSEPVAHGGEVNLALPDLGSPASRP